MTAAEKAARIGDAYEAAATELIASKQAASQMSTADQAAHAAASHVRTRRPLTARQFAAALNAGCSLPRAPWED